MKTLAQRRADAAERMEACAAELLAMAERWTITGRTIWDHCNDRRALLAVARRYGDSVRRLSRLR